MELNEALRKLRKGELSIEQFARASRPAWERIATHHARDLPPWMDLEDVVQELLTKALEVWPRYDPDHPHAPPFETYVYYTVTAFVQKRVASARGARRRGGYGPARYELAISGQTRAAGDLDHETQEERVLNKVATRTTAEDDVFTAQVFDRAAKGKERRLQAALEALAEADSVDEGARRLYDNVNRRLACELGCRTKARELVKQAAVEVAAVLESEGIKPAKRVA